MNNNDTFAVEAIEGSLWIPWEYWQKLRVPGPEGKRVHAILFQDGRTWDAVNGFRGRRDGPTCFSNLGVDAWYTPEEMVEFLEVWEEVKRLYGPLTERQRMIADEMKRLQKVLGDSLQLKKEARGWPS